MRCELEICAYSLESCSAAKAAGADRVELCAGFYEGGTTPSWATIRLARKLTEGMELYVMVRPRGGDFLYSDLEFRQMQEEIRCIRETGADGVVLGMLDAAGRIDVRRTTELVKCAAPLKVTFHRAFDMCRDGREALESVLETGCYRILTSGLQNTAPEGREALKKLVKQADGRIRIMAGSGVNAANVASLVNLGVDAVHMSGKSVRDSGMAFRNPAVCMGGVPGIPEYDIAYSDEAKIREVKAVLDQLSGIVSIEKI